MSAFLLPVNYTLIKLIFKERAREDDSIYMRFKSRKWNPKQRNQSPEALGE
jgi:hypothetical protein